MDKTTHYVYSSELYHYGRKGMKWGQNIFGKKRSGAKGTVVAKKKKSILDKAKEAKEAKKKAKAAASEAERKKDPRNMTDDEIRKAIARKQLENQYRQYYPEKVSKGKQLVSKFLDESLTPALISSGKKFLGDAFDMFGKKVLDQYKPKEELTEQQKLDKARDKAKAEYEIADYKNKKANVGKEKEPEIQYTKILANRLAKQKLDEMDIAEAAKEAKVELDLSDIFDAVALLPATYNDKKK